MMHRYQLSRSFRILALALFALGTPLALAACNTTEGVGEDISAAGDAIDDAADDAND